MKNLLSRYLNILLVVVPLFWVFFSPQAGAADIAVRAAVEKQEVFTGEPIHFQIIVDGADSPAEPDLSAIKDFQVLPRGGQSNSSESITIINGRMERVSLLGYVFSYQLLTKKTGRLLIPAIAVEVDGKTFRTQELAITAKKPVETEDVRLRLNLSKNHAYPGEPLTLEIVWYLARDVKDFAVDLPFLADDRFEVVPVAEEVPPDRAGDYVPLPLGNKTLPAKRGTGELEGRTYTTVTGKFTLIPRQAGDIKLQQAKVSCRVLTGYSQERQPGGEGPRDKFFDDFFGRPPQAVYQTVIALSNEPVLSVAPLPASGRPQYFKGLVGKYEISASAEPTEVSVGDPITLTILVSGANYLDNVPSPVLSELPGFSGNFKIPSETAPGEKKGGAQTFVQTVRAAHDGVREIPAVHLSYFNPLKGAYETISSRPIPLRVKVAREVTAADAEGGNLSPAREDPRDLAVGISYNYEDPSVLKRQDPVDGVVSLRLVFLALLIPPGLYIFLAAGRWIYRRRHGDQEKRLARQTQAQLFAKLQQIEASPDNASEALAALHSALRVFLGRRLRVAPGALTSADILVPLKASGVDDRILGELKAIFEACEACRYGGSNGIGFAELRTLVGRTREVCKTLSQSLNRVHPETG